MTYVNKPCLCVEESLNYNYKDKKLNNSVVTPYYKNAIMDRDPFWYEHLSSNVTPYQLFVLKTRLIMYIDPNYDITFNSYRNKDKAQYILEADNLSDSYPTLTDHETKKYQKLINKILNCYPNHCALIHINQDFLSNIFTQYIDKNFIITNLPKYYKMIDKKYNPILLPNQLIVDLSFDIDYTNTFNQLQNDLINYIYNKTS